MGLNISKGNMYDFVTHTWNTVKGKCSHDCSYCYMKRFKNQKEMRFDKTELKTDLGDGNFIFVGSSNDLFQEHIPYAYQEFTLLHIEKYPNNKYFFQSKNPRNFGMLGGLCKKIGVDNVKLCTTLETNRFYPEIMNNCKTPHERAFDFQYIKGVEKFITIEPIMDFDLEDFVEILKSIEPAQVNIGANSDKTIKLPEPTKEKLLQLIKELEKFTVIHSKRNLNRLLV